jgi:hypothetical protein
MENQILGWADLAMDTAEVGALVAGLLLLIRVCKASRESAVPLMAALPRPPSDTAGRCQSRRFAPILSASAQGQ